MDNHTHNMLDSLADLFLTGTGGAAAPQPGARKKGHGPVGEQLDGPTPIRLAPKLGGQARPQRQPPPALRLRGTEHDDPVGPTHAAGARVEAVFLGSLPGFAGPWLTQYAQWRANDVGTVGVLHTDEGQVDVELVGRPDASMPRIATMGQNLAEMIRAFPAVKLWLICPSLPVDEAIMQRLDRVERWTVLCGADEPAVLGASQLISKLLEADAMDSPSATDRSIGLMIMGCDPAVAHSAVDRLNTTLDGLVEQPIQLLGSLKQMGPVSVRIVGSYESPTEAWPAVLDAMICPQMLQAPSQAQAEYEEEPPAAPAAAPPRRAAAPPPIASQSPAPAAPPVIAEAEPDLSTFIAGGLALQARCPHHPQTQLMLDQDGRLHLLRRHAGEASDLYAAVIDLIEARKWVDDHLELIKLTQRQCRFDERAQPVLHLFTDQAKHAATLISRLGQFAKLHLFQRVQAGAESTWFCADLN